MPALPGLGGVVGPGLVLRGVVGPGLVLRGVVGPGLAAAMLPGQSAIRPG